ncbi:MAG: hypothetical protein IPG61_09130 [bacterium]|nr:hypothetical protein [bacterium]
MSRGRSVRARLAPAQVLVVVAVVSAALLATAAPSHACVCSNEPITRLFADADVVFVGTPTAWRDPNEGAGSRSSADPIHYTFDVELAWKGVDTDTLTVLTPAGGSSCGRSFQIGERYLILCHLRDGRPWTGLCSGDDLLQNAMAARYLLSAPVPVVPGAEWPALGRDGLLEWMRIDNVEARCLAASLLTGEYEVRDQFGLSAAGLAVAAHAAAVPIFAAHVDSTALAAALADLARGLLNDDREQNRAAGIRALGRLATAHELGAVLRHGFADPQEGPRAAARAVMMARGHDLAPADAAAGVEGFIASLATIGGEGLWMGVHQLRYLPEPHGPVRAFVDSLLAASSDEMVLRMAAEVRRELGNP